jgi:hypothetical protein
MRLTVRRAWTAFFVLFVSLDLCGRPAASQPNGKARAPAALAGAAGTARRIGLYSPRVRRSTVMYLRLRLLELREEGLERARAVIEHRLSIDELLGEPAGATQEAPGPARRTVVP